MASGDKKRKGSAKKKAAIKYSNGNRLQFNKIRKEIKNLLQNPRDIDGLNRCQKIVYMGPLESKLKRAIQASKEALGLNG